VSARPRWRPSRAYAFFALAALSILMVSIDSTVVAVALPSMVDDLKTSLVWLGWTFTAYLLTQTAVMPLAGKLTESFGRMRVFLGCVLLFTLGSLLCGLAPNIELLIAFRVLQALGGGGILPAAAGLVAREFPENRGRMIGLFSSIFPIGGVVGPNLGGLIVEHWSWRDVFLINVPIGIVVLLVLWRWGHAREDVQPHSMDVVGALLFAAAISAFLGGLSLLGNDPSAIRSPLCWALLGGSLVLVLAFTWHELRAPEPILEPSLVARGPFLAVNTYNFIYGACVFGFFTFVPYYAVVQFGMTPAQSGAVLTPRSLVAIATATTASMLLTRWGYRAPMLIGMACLTSTLLLLSQGWGELNLGTLRVGAFPLLAAQLLLAGVGTGLSAPASNNAILDLMPERTAVITGIRGVFRSTGGVVGTAVIVVALELSPDRAAGLRSIFLFLAGLLLLTIPLTFAIPDTARARRRTAPAAPTTTPGSAPGRSGRAVPVRARDRQAG
jgi:EmrB/QacA subfamily drug resistance transporter